MNKNIKYIIPMVAIAGFALTSCNKATTGYLKRETFGTKVEKLADLKELAANMKTQQYDETAFGDVLFPFYKLPDKGTVTTNINIAFSGSIRILQYYVVDPSHPDLSIDVNNVNVLIQDKITTEWDLTHNDYFRCTNKTGASYFIQKNNEGKWIKYFETPVGSNKYCEDITEYIGTGTESFNPLTQFGSFKNYALYQIAASNGLLTERRYRDDDEPVQINGFGLGISGFAGDEGVDPDKLKRISVRNAYAPGMLFSDHFKIDDDYPMYQFIDEVAANEPLTKILPIKAKHTKKSDNTAFSTSIGISKFNFKNSQAFLDELKAEIPEEFDDIQLTADGSGSGKLDYFNSYKDNWINQTEFSLTLNNANLQFIAYNPDTDGNREDYSSVAYVNIKDVYSRSYINQDFNNGTCKYKEPDTSGYILVNPTPEAK